MNEPGDQSRSPWHAGEKYCQEWVGVSESMEVFGRRVVRDHMPDQHRNFYRILPYVFMGTVDDQGFPWATLLEGPPGFAHSPDPKTLQFEALPGANDPAGAHLRNGSPVGMLGIDLITRRRNRLNGHVTSISDSGLVISVDQAFGNCPQYIQLRQIERAPDGDHRLTPDAEFLDHLDAAATDMIRQADTFFVASYADIDGDPATRGVDVSHRGGNAGFVRVDGDCLMIPDFAGNLHFNTLGNFLINPVAGLLFIDFPTGDVLQVSGRAEVIFDDPQIQAFQGAERLWRVQVEKVVRRPAALASHWQFQAFSPNSEMTGSWEQTAARLQAEQLRDTWRPFRVTEIIEESQSIRSFYFEPTDGAGLPRFEAGQHLPVRFLLEGQKSPSIRTYSLSSAPSDAFFRISVKRDGTVSSHLHDTVRVGDLVEARAPQGHFTVDADEERPLVLLAAGVGVTPLLSMLREVVYEGKRIRRTRPTWFVQSARSLAELAFHDEIIELATRGGDDVRALRLLSQPETHAREGEGFELAGRIDIELLKALLPLNDYDFYLCGPSSFTQTLYDGLRALRIDDDRIHAETFGPSMLIRDLQTMVPALEQVPAASEPVKVLFSTSAKEARWEPGGGTLLELAESRGLNPEYSCRGGSCGTCKTRLISGRVHYLNMPADPLPDDEVLICCAVPAQGGEALVLDI
ncbi:pyridoxamine 5'-phosphate oxidase family protein [Pseudomonas sp. NA-150]|uniref:pyridoxamine 5'-phosphate oxidase family protein n=1 Tax=Pseudomonas sp. NA-150 TaxID=3367525 RepID=UPI0037C89335